MALAGRLLNAAVARLRTKANVNPAAPELALSPVRATESLRRRNGRLMRESDPHVQHHEWLWKAAGLAVGALMVLGDSSLLATSAACWGLVDTTLRVVVGVDIPVIGLALAVPVLFVGLLGRAIGQRSMPLRL